jgi:RNA polymerase sigma-70 factor (ECF subfamily)
VSDDALIHRMARQDTDAATELFRRLSPLVYALAHRITGVPEDAEEVLVDSFHQAWSQAHRYDARRASVTGWLLNIARSRALDHVRARGRRLTRHEKAAQDVADFPLQEPESPERSAMRSQARERLRKVLLSLPSDQRRAVELAYFGGLSHSEIAEHLGQPLGTIKNRLRLAMKKIQSSITDVEEVGL